MDCLALGRMHVECGHCNAEGAQGAPSALGRQIFVADVHLLGVPYTLDDAFLALLGGLSSN